MNSMNDERFFDLAMKVIAKQATDPERAELDALIAREPELRSEFARLQADVRVAQAALPLVDATRATTGEVPAYARGRLQTKVRQTLGRPAAEKESDRSLAWGWRWVLGLAAATAVVVLIVLPMLRNPKAAVIQVAMLDATGGTRSTDTTDVALLQETWKGSRVQNFSSASELEAWEKAEPGADKRPVAKIIYDRAAGELRVVCRRKGTTKTFVVGQDLEAALRRAKAYLDEELKR
jgi:hypothetical protein